MLKSLQHCLHQLILVGNKMFNLGVGLVVGVVALAICSCSLCSPSERFF
jgi:hypothetical protein